MSTPRQILAAIFDMDGLLIYSEPLWDRAEVNVMASLGVALLDTISYPIHLDYALIWSSISGLRSNRGTAPIA